LSQQPRHFTINLISPLILCFIFIAYLKIIVCSKLILYLLASPSIECNDIPFPILAIHHTKHLSHTKGGRLSTTMQIKATISVSIQQLAILFFYNPFHIIIKHYSGCCGCNQCHCNVIFVMWAYKFSSLLIRNGKKIWSQHLYCTKFKFWIIENGMKFDRRASYTILKISVTN